MNDAATAISALPPKAAKMAAVEILLADPESLGDDVLESCLYILRERLRAAGPARPRIPLLPQQFSPQPGQRKGVTSQGVQLMPR